MKCECVKDGICLLGGCKCKYNAIEMEPLGAVATIQWKDDKSIISNVFFSFKDEENLLRNKFFDETDDDDNVFFYCDGEKDLKSFMVEGIEDFIVLSYELRFTK